MSITKKQLEVLEFIENFIAEKGYSPSYREIGEGVNIKSLGGIHDYITALIDRNMIKVRANKSRSIEIVGADETLLTIKIQKIYKKSTVQEKQIIRSALKILGFENLTKDLD